MLQACRDDPGCVTESKESTKKHSVPNQAQQISICYICLDRFVHQGNILWVTLWCLLDVIFFNPKCRHPPFCKLKPCIHEYLWGLRINLWCHEFVNQMSNVLKYYHNLSLGSVIIFRLKNHMQGRFGTIVTVV